jgi:hypothetical protein
LLYAAVPQRLGQSELGQQHKQKGGPGRGSAADDRLRGFFQGDRLLRGGQTATDYLAWDNGGRCNPIKSRGMATTSPANGPATAASKRARQFSAGDFI